MASSPRILIVEDNAGALEALSVILQDEGYETQCAANGREALDRTREATSGSNPSRSAHARDEWLAISRTPKGMPLQGNTSFYYERLRPGRGARRRILPETGGLRSSAGSNSELLASLETRLSLHASHGSFVSCCQPPGASFSHPGAEIARHDKHPRRRTDTRNRLLIAGNKSNVASYDHLREGPFQFFELDQSGFEQGEGLLFAENEIVI